jgi:hypothetical protein
MTMAGNSSVTARMKEQAALMKERGLIVKYSSGWESRGTSSSFDPYAVICHHTAATTNIDSVLINGRADLPGPLCNWALHGQSPGDGIWVAIASGKANHAGEGTIPNSGAYGIEATGPFGYPGTYGPAAFPYNYDEYAIGVACILEVEGWNTYDCYQHKETARPVGRKIDCWYDSAQFERDVQEGVSDVGLTEDDRIWIDKKIELLVEAILYLDPKNENTNRRSSQDFSSDLQSWWDSAMPNTRTLREMERATAAAKAAQAAAEATLAIVQAPGKKR